MKKLATFLLILLWFLPTGLSAQDEEVEVEYNPKNFIKTNITSIILTNNYSFQYERVLTKRLSIGVSYRFMPESGVPNVFKGIIKGQADEDDDYETQVLDKLNMSNTAITPELRFYLGKGYGRGFYIAPYYRYAKFDISGYNLQFDKEDGSQGEVKISGDFTSHSGGIMFGAQWALGKYVVLDWWILGAHFGSATGSLHGRSDENLSIIDQQNIKDEIEDFEFFDKVTVVDEHNVKVDVSGPWAGIRMGISLGIRF